MFLPAKTCVSQYRAVIKTNQFKPLQTSTADSIVTSIRRFCTVVCTVCTTTPEPSCQASTYVPAAEPQKPGPISLWEERLGCRTPHRPATGPTPANHFEKESARSKPLRWMTSQLVLCYRPSWWYWYPPNHKTCKLTQLPCLDQLGAP